GGFLPLTFSKVIRSCHLRRSAKLHTILPPEFSPSGLSPAASGTTMKACRPKPMMHCATHSPKGASSTRTFAITTAIGTFRPSALDERRPHPPMNIVGSAAPARAHAFALPAADNTGRNTGVFEALNHSLVLVLINPIVIFHQTSPAEAGTSP